MTKGFGFKPELEISVTLRKIPIQYGTLITEVMGGALEEVKDLAQLSDPTTAIDAAIEIGQKEMTLRDVRDAMVEKAMRSTDGNIPAAAKLLGVTQRTLYRWVNTKGKEALT